MAQLTTMPTMPSNAYLTVAEYKQAPTAVDVDDLVGAGSQAVNDVELRNVILRASSWADWHVGRPLGATQDTHSQRCRVSRDGFLRVHPRYDPVLSVVSASMGTYPTSLYSLDVTTAWVEDVSVVFPISSFASQLGALQFNRPYSTTRETFTTLVYVAGYANTTLTANASLGATSITVADRTGFIPGLSFTLYDGTSTETVTVGSTYVPATGAGTVGLQSVTTAAHTASAGVSALPPTVKQATIYLTNVLLKSRGNSALVMDTLTPTQIAGDNPAVAADYQMACTLLKPFRRMR